MSIVIKVENLSKQYRLGLVGASTFKEDTNRWWAKLRGKEDPFLKLGIENDRTIKDNSKFVWSLKDINFEVNQGDVLGVIGRNGAGKSTLLKILSKVTAPTTGSVKVKGRIASLLEVGTGFHPELTGRENIFLNGAILGMRKHEIKRKLDEIITFAGVERYIDTPVKRYSSGMYVRLAFAVAAHLESEILIIDEVLAVGDVEFQKKCLGKIGDLSSGEGRTVLFVSHNMAAVSSLCTRAIYLENGLIKLNSSVDNVINVYTNSNFSTNINVSYINSNSVKSKFNIIKAFYTNSDNGKFNLGSNICIDLLFELLCDLNGSVLNLTLSNFQTDLFVSFDTDEMKIIGEIRKKGLYTSHVVIDTSYLKPGFYTLTLITGVFFGEIFEEHRNCLSFELLCNDKQLHFRSFNPIRNGLIKGIVNWS